MQRIMMILEVSQKQNYIFASRIQRENMQRSINISTVTGHAFFQEACPDGYSREANMVYSGGGHTVLQFDTKEQADRFARAVTRRAMDRYPGLELFVAQLPYDESKTPGDNLNDLSRALEIKKSKREHIFRTHAFGIELSEGATESGRFPINFKLPRGWKSTSQVDIADGDDNFLAIVHIDGNAMGSRVQDIYKACQDNWEDCRRLLDLFSVQIDTHFSQAFNDMAQDLADNLEYRYQWKPSHVPKILPLRKIIGAGDDVCFITSGKLGMECAASFLRHLSGKRNEADGKLYTACAGVVLVHKKYPFRQAYDLSEELCRSAKNFCKEYGGDISALDFHIEYGQLKGTLAQIRADYLTDDNARLELRPLAVTGGSSSVPKERTYRFQKDQLWQLSRALEEDAKFKRGDGLVRSKIKPLRTALHEGEIEAKLALKQMKSNKLLELNNVDSPFFTDDKGVKRCLYFDTIELLDATTLWREVRR